MKNLESTLGQQLQQQQKSIDEALRKFFDPKDGKVYERLQHFIGDKGVLEQQLQKCLAPDNGLMATTLARQVGESSPLLKMLSPTDSEGVVKSLEVQVQKVLDSGHQRLGLALDPSIDGSAISRFLKSLEEKLKNSSLALDEKLATALKALDANDEDSLISRLVRDTGKAQEQVLRAMNPETPDSPISQLQNALKKLVNEHATKQTEMLEQARQRQTNFESEVKEALGRLEVRRQADEQTTRGGLDFEMEVIRQMEILTAGMPCTVSGTGDSVGALSRSKVGDALLEFTDESAFSGCRIVVEAKRSGAYTVAKALEEMKVARENRKADIGVFVLASSRANERFPLLSRVGPDILVQWDVADEQTDITLRASLMLAMGLVARVKAPQQEGSLDDLEDVGKRITDELSRFDAMRKSVEGIRKNTNKLDDQLRIGRRKMELLLEHAENALRALGVNLLEYELHAEESLDFAENRTASTVTLSEPANDAQLDPVEPIRGKGSLDSLAGRRR